MKTREEYEFAVLDSFRRDWDKLQKTLPNTFCDDAISRVTFGDLLEILERIYGNEKYFSEFFNLTHMTDLYAEPQVAWEEVPYVVSYLGNVDWLFNDDGVPKLVEVELLSKCRHKSTMYRICTSGCDGSHLTDEIAESIPTVKCKYHEISGIRYCVLNSRDFIDILNALSDDANYSEGARRFSLKSYKFNGDVYRKIMDSIKKQ